MQKTLFKKYLRVTLAIILISFFLLGLVMLVFIKSYWQDEKQDLLRRNAESIAGIAAASTTPVQGDNYILLDTERMQSFMNAFSENMDADIYVTNRAGEWVLSAFGSGGTVNETTFTRKTMDKALMGPYSGQGTVDGIYNSPYYVVGVPIRISNLDGTRTTIGAVFTACSARSFNEYRNELMKMFLLAAVAAFLVAFCISWMFSYKLVRPLRDMALAARSFGEGNFSVRVPVTSQEIGRAHV